ncbi:hypothetical protein VE01_08977 [Pseudogymnoascus verrucosus]|uniref:Uncharacterized protein n=1 Tax=Pseudogymnoascus verrucosus TaxID=342668 RepID=A0A1B8GB57_9PEZI|nr:uncharacterized protein VE01_08977 [Pseudogymnoascus verrucosus]OBT93062.1 hypothetical protein VE01_08977 [Pseudogymnoascus verrucosus]
MLMPSTLSAAAAALMLAATAHGDNFTIINGQIFTPGLAIVDAPQPNTPLGGEILQVAIDVSGNGKLGLPPYSDSAPSQLHALTLFLTSYTTGLNLTIANGTALPATSSNSPDGIVMTQEPGSTVKHVNWLWPACLSGDGQPKATGLVSDGGSARGAYNISIHQSFRLNDTEYYTVFNLPIAVTNRISESANQSSCESLTNLLLGWGEVVGETVVLTPDQYPWTDGSGVQVSVPSGDGSDNGGSSDGSDKGDGIGGSKPDANAGDGLGGGAGMVAMDGRLTVLAVIFALGLVAM